MPAYVIRFILGFFAVVFLFFGFDEMGLTSSAKLLLTAGSALALTAILLPDWRGPP